MADLSSIQLEREFTVPSGGAEIRVARKVKNHGYILGSLESTIVDVELAEVTNPENIVGIRYVYAVGAPTAPEPLAFIATVLAIGQQEDTGQAYLQVKVTNVANANQAMTSVVVSYSYIVE